MENECGECRECCVELAIDPASGGDVLPLGKAAGVPCPQLDAGGCALHATAAQPTLCRTYLCLWRQNKWMRSRPAYRPDRLGVMFHPTAGGLALFETRPGAFDANANTIQYIQGRTMPGSRLLWHPYGVVHHSGTAGKLRDDTERVTLPNGDVMVRFKAGAAARMPLPVVR